MNGLRLNEFFYRKLYIESGPTTAIVGAYYGIVFDAIFFNGTPQRINITGSRLKFVARFVVSLIIWFLPCYFPGLIIHKKSLFSDSDSYMGEYILRYALPYLLFSMLLFSYSKIIMAKCRIVNWGQKNTNYNKR